MTDKTKGTPHSPLDEQPKGKESLKISDFVMDLGELTLEEIVGQDDAIREFKALVSMLRYRPLYEMWGAKPPKGILLTGSTGLGKTASVKALAKELRGSVVLMELRYLDIASKWVDAPIEQLRDFFKVAEEQSRKHHVIIFVDEVDAMIPDRNNQLHETSSKRVNVFLEWMDGGFESRHNITIIGATNFIEGVDSAARRPGRFDKVIPFANLTPEAIIHGLEIHTGKRKLSSLQIGDINWQELLPHLSKGSLTGADLPEMINRAIDKKIELHKQRINISIPAFDKASADEMSTLINNPEYYPEPITTEDMILSLQEFIAFKRNTGSLSKAGLIGFQMST